MSPKLKRDRKLEWIPVERIIPNETNPRDKRHFAAEQLLPLRASIEEHGILEAIIVQPYRDGPREDRYLILEGERRYHVAKELGLKQMPAVITNRLDEHDQLVVMFNVHANRRGWETAEQLNAIKLLKERNGHKSDQEIAKELGMKLATYKDRLRVLGMGDEVITAIARSKLDFTSALRIDQVASSLGRHRPEVTQKLGGEEGVKNKLLQKANQVGGIANELVYAKRDLSDVNAVPDNMVETYLGSPKATIRDLYNQHGDLAERRKAEDLSEELRKVERAIRAFDANLEDVPNLRQLRHVLGSLMDAAENLEIRVVEALNDRDGK